MNIVSLDDKVNDDLKEDQMCKLCTKFAAYDGRKRFVQHKGSTALHLFCGVWEAVNNSQLSA